MFKSRFIGFDLARYGDEKSVKFRLVVCSLESGEEGHWDIS